MTRDITVAGGNVNTKVAFKNCASFKTCWTERNYVFADEADYIYIEMHIIIQFNVVTIMLILQDVYDSLKEMKSIIMSMKTLKVAHHININQIILMMQQQIEQLKM